MAHGVCTRLRALSVSPVNFLFPGSAESQVPVQGEGLGPPPDIDS